MNDDSAYRRLDSLGLHAASPTDLFTVALSRQQEDCGRNTAAATKLLRMYKPRNWPQIAQGDLRDLAGLERFEAARFLAAIELGRRAALAPSDNVEDVGSPEAVAELFAWLEFERKEHFCAAYLDSKNGLIVSLTLHIGVVDASMVGAREVFRPAVREGASSVILVHNHPSGDPTPSPEDLQITALLVDAGKLLDIPVLDHVILGRGRHVSLRRQGMI